MQARERGRVVAVARGDAAADRYVRGGLLLNVYTGEVYPANVAIVGERIAYVGLRDDMVGPRTDVVDASGRTLVPGYIEPHAHPWVFTTPTALARHVLPLGTTTIVGDNLVPYLLGGVAGFERAAAAVAHGPLRYYWMARPHSQARGEEERRRFPLAAMRRMLRHPSVLAVGEVTRWHDVLAGQRGLLERIGLAAEAGKRVEGHTAGASPEKVGALVAAGFTSDHEPITGSEALERARLGLAVMLRQSSLRRDLRALLEPFAGSALSARLMLTTDGSTPAFVAQHGFVDSLVRLAIDVGIPPVEAYRMATLNPAAYYGRDHELGGIAPGRYADILLLRDLAEPRPETVIARGRVAARRGRLLPRVPEPAWDAIFTRRGSRFDRAWSLRPDELVAPRGDLPVIKLVSAVITRLEQRPMAEGDLHASLLGRRGEWVATTAVAGFASTLDGLATTLSTDQNVLVLGRRPEAMARAANRLIRLRGGLVLVEGERIVFELPLPVGGMMSRRPLADVAEAERQLEALLAERGHRFHAPMYSLLFLSADFLPAVRLTADGVWDVKRRRVLRPGRRREG
jgi:adenine deaminase